MSDTSDVSDSSEDSTQAYDEDEPDMDIIAVQKEMDCGHQLQGQFTREDTLQPTDLSNSDRTEEEPFHLSDSSEKHTQGRDDNPTIKNTSNKQGQIKREAPLPAMSGCNKLPTLVGALLLKAAKQNSLVLVRALLCHTSSDLAVRDEKGNTALHIAASSGHHDVVEELAGRVQATRLKTNCLETEHKSKQNGDQHTYQHISPVDCPNSAGNTPVMVASTKGRVCVVKILLSKFKASSMACNKHNNSCMHLASLHGHIPVIDFLVHGFGCSPHTKGCNNRTPLHYASGGGHVELVDKMISDPEYKCDKMARDIEGHTPLHAAAMCGKISVVRLLISKHKCPVECTDNEGNTALLCAARRGHVNVVNTLHAKFGASVEYTAHNGCTALLLASSMGHCNLVEVLLSVLGANVEAWDNNRNTAINLAALHGHNHVLSVLIDKIGYTSVISNTRPPLHQACSGGHLHVVKMLISKYNCDPMVKNRGGLTSLHVAAGSGKVEVVKNLVTEYSCPVDCVDNEGNTPFHSACSSGCRDVIDVFQDFSIKHGSILACRNNNGICAVHIAAFFGHINVVTALVDYFGHQLEAKDYHNRTALHYAAGGGRLQMVKTLVTKYKCDPMARDDEGLTSVHIAALAGMRHIVRLLVIELNTPIQALVSSEAIHSIPIQNAPRPYQLDTDASLHDTLRNMLEYLRLSKSEFQMETPLNTAAGSGREELVRFLITNQLYSAHCADSKGFTPLMVASRYGHASIVRMLVSEFGADVRAKDRYNQTALHFAAFGGHEDVVSLLIDEFGCSPDTKGRGNTTPLHAACQQGNVYMVKKLISDYGCDKMARDKGGATPLHFAADFGRDEVIKVLVTKYSCPANCVDHTGETPLMHASEQGHRSTVRLLIDKYKCDPNARDQYGRTPLYAAAYCGRKEMVRMLVKAYKCPVDSANNCGSTPLMAASCSGHAGVVKMLVSELNADVEARDKDGQTALAAAVGQGHRTVVSMLINELSCSTDTKTSDGLTLLHCACQGGDVDIVNELICEHNCDPMARDNSGGIPLHTAARWNRVDVIKLLVTKHNSPVDCIDNQGYTPLAHASIRGHTSAVKLLIFELKADVEVRDKGNKTALHLAILRGHKDLINLLLNECNCDPESEGPYGTTLIHAVCAGGHLDILKDLVYKFKCDPMAKDNVGMVPLHTAAACGKENVVKHLIIEHGCPVDSISKTGITPTHLAAYGGELRMVKLLTDVFGAFPSNKTDRGYMDCNPVETSFRPQILTCYDHLHQHGIQEMRNPPKKVLILGELSRRIAELINACSTYSLPQSHLKESACFLNYVNEDLRDIWMCQCSGKDAYSSTLVQALMSGSSYIAILVVDLDKAIGQVRDEIHSQVTVIKQLTANSRNIKSHIIICGISSISQLHQQSLSILHGQAKTMISQSTRIKLVKPMSLYLPTMSPERSPPLIETLKKTVINTSKVRYGSVYLFKLMLRDFSNAHFVTFTQLHKHLHDKQVCYDDICEDIWVFLNELDSLRFICIVGSSNNPESALIIINYSHILNELHSKCKKSSDPLIRMGILTKTLLSTFMSTPMATYTILTLLNRFGFPCAKFSLQHFTSNMALRHTSDTFFFMPHIITDARQSRKWFLSCDNPFTIGFLLDVVEGSDLFSLELQYSLLIKTVQYLIGLLEVNKALKGYTHFAIWVGGTMWKLNDVEILAEVFENGKGVIIMVRSSSYSLKDIHLFFQVGSIMMNLIHQYCGHVLYKTYAINCDALGVDPIPLATSVPRVEASIFLHALKNDLQYVQDSNGVKVEIKKLNWLQWFTLKGHIFTVKEMDVSDILEQVSGKWKDIGRELGVPEKKLQALQNTELPPDQCCSKMIEEWLMYSSHEPSWYCLTEALKKLSLTEEVGNIMRKWGSYVDVQTHLKDKGKENEVVTDDFLLQFAGVVEPHWNLLAPYIAPLEYGVRTSNILQQLQAWKKEKSPTYRDLNNDLSKLILDPVTITGDKDEDVLCGINIVSEEGIEVAELNDEEVMEEKMQKDLLDKALEEGHIRTGMDVLLFIGAAGSGKSHYKHLCLGLPPPEVRNSTGLSEHPVRTMSLVRGAVEQKPQNRETTDCTSLEWHKIPAKEFIELIIEAILEDKLEKISDPERMKNLTQQAFEGLQTTDMERGHETLEIMRSTETGNVPDVEFEGSRQDQITSENSAVFQSDKSYSPTHVPYQSEFYQNLLTRLKLFTKSQTKGAKLLDVDWIYIVDSGGQPQFREMLPVLVQVATACVLTLKLNEPLGDLNEVKYFRKGKQLGTSYSSVLTNEQIVKHCSQIVDSQTKDCKLFVVGTHRDLERKCKGECRAKKNEKLLKLLQSQLGANLEVYKPNDPIELIYPVNSKTPNKDDYGVVEQFRKAVHSIPRTKEKVDIPLYWFLLELLLHQLAADKGILSFEGCKDEAIKQLKISEEAFPTAVKFLAQKLGTIMYFPKVLPGIIFTPQALLNILSEIVKVRHLLNDSQALPPELQGHSGEWLKFKRCGIMTKILLQSAPLKGFFSEIFTPDNFLTIMTKLLIVARIPSDAFFLPSVLEELSPTRVQQKVSKSCECLAPLVLRCSDSVDRGESKENWLPVGSFTSLVARLLNVNKWTLCKDKMQNPSCLYRNCIQFTLPNNQPGIVTLVDKFKHMEVYLQVDARMAKRISKNVCPNIYYGLKRVHKCLHYSKSEVEMAFLCPKKNHGSHIATLARLGHWKWTCQQNHSISGDLTKKQSPWLQDCPEDPKVSVLMNEVAATLPAKWELFAVQIELEYDCILEIKQKYPNNNYGCFMAVLQHWNSHRPVPFTWERVIEVLRSRSIQEVRVAETIAKKFCPSPKMCEK